MGSAMFEINCPKCGFERAIKDLNCRSRDEYVNCCRCGYTSHFVVDWEKTKLEGKLFSEYGETGGRGCYSYKPKESIAFITGPVKKGSINALKSELDDFVICKYSFRRKGKWFIKDLLSKKTEPFSYNSMLNVEDRDVGPDCHTDNSERDWDEISW
jgi:hypothetical protein